MIADWVPLFCLSGLPGEAAWSNAVCVEPHYMGLPAGFSGRGVKHIFGFIYSTVRNIHKVVLT